MLKKRVKSKNKEIEESRLLKTKRTFLVDKNQRNIIKKNNIYAYKPKYHESIGIKSALITPDNFLLTRSTKSSNITPKMSRKSSKQNITSNASLFYPHDKRKQQQNIHKNQADQNIIDDLPNNRSHKKRSDYMFIYQIGSGGFGKVWKVEDKKQNKVYAMKEMSKAKIISKKSVNSIMNEKQLLEDLKSNFIVNSYCSFQDRQNLYLVLEYLKGGDLRYHMCFYEYFDEDQTKFIIACIIQGLQYIHSHNIIHRDIKPENIIFQQNGYLRITDFGVARKKKMNNSEQTSGTPGYMSPEVICRMNHSFQSDYFAIGIITYELIFGTRPYLGDSRKQIREKILAHQAQIHPKDLPSGWNPSCVDFVNKLLKRNKETRLGYNGISQLKDHPWLSGINWSKLSKKQLKPPFIPGVVCQSREYQKQMEETEQTRINEETAIFLRAPQIQKLFRKYDGAFKKQKNKPKIMDITASRNFKKNFLR